MHNTTKAPVNDNVDLGTPPASSVVTGSHRSERNFVIARNGRLIGARGGGVNRPDMRGGGRKTGRCFDPLSGPAELTLRFRRRPLLSQKSKP